MALEKTKKQSVAAAVATSQSSKDDGGSKKKTSNTDPNKQPGFAEQERALSPTGKGGGGAAKTEYAEPKLGKVSVKSIKIAANGKLTAVVEAKISGANNVKGTVTRTYTLTGSSSLNPFECAECVYDAFQGLNMEDVGLDGRYNIDPVGRQRNAFMEEAISAVFDKSRFTDERDRSTWPEGYADRFEKRP